MAEAPILRITGLSKAFDRKPLPANISLCVLLLVCDTIALQSRKSGYKHLVPPESKRKTELPPESAGSDNPRRPPDRMENDIEFRKQWKPFLPSSFETAKMTLTAYRLADTNSNNLPAFHGYPFQQKLNLKDEKLSEHIIQQMNLRENFAGSHDACFEPGLGIRLQNDKESMDALICLTCHELNSFHSFGAANMSEIEQDHPLSGKGVNQFAVIYNELFPARRIDFKHLQ